MTTTAVSTHTPGPWTRDGTIMSDHLEIDLRLDEEGENWVTIKGDRDAVVEANARLIAAAPEMLEALREIDRLASKVGRDAITVVARVAIAKAEGAR